MTTRLAGTETNFPPFNQGGNGSGVSGPAGNDLEVWELILEHESVVQTAVGE